MPYDFSRISPQAFERLAQAIVAKQFGAGVKVYGVGADGGREASYEGRVPIETASGPWDGYVVVQAKCRTKSSPGTSNVAWLKRELDKEIKKFLDARRRLRKPEYYLLITNVTLSPVQSSPARDGRRSRKGGIEKVDEVLDTWQAQLGLRGWQVWHADTLIAFLDGDVDIRTRYAAWITEGDVLAAALGSLRRVDMARVVPRAISRDLRRDRDIKRKDAGQITERGIFLDEVFVDLPIWPFSVGPEDQRYILSWDTLTSADNVGDPVTELVIDAAVSEDEFVEMLDDSSEVEKSGEPGAVYRLLQRAADKLDPKSVEGHIRHQRYRGRPNRIVLMGGPGQGKSTVAQFLAQICRARVVQAQEASRVSDEAREASEFVLRRAEAEGLPLDGPRRFPVHIELPKFADALAEAAKRSDRLSLLRYAAELIARGGDDAFPHADLRDWLGAYPWLLILDGLDEVPPSGNRPEVVEAINDFWDEVHETNADVLVVVTTRPQGYGNDLPHQQWQHWTLRGLKAGDALHFASRLAEVVLSDGSRREEIIAELRRASEDAATAPIMVSPLQVAILFSLVETKGGVPTDRWTLFHRYYELLRDREAAKEGSTAKLLRDYRSHIDQIHYDAGFLLHVRAEYSGSANPHLARNEFQDLIERQLRSEGHSAKTIAEVSQEIVRIATDRLVLLGCKVQEQIAFDVRSLQEFMAAGRIMASPEAKIPERLHEIAARVHWRHVMRIAASKVFAFPELRHLRQVVIHVCDALDHDLTPADIAVRSGARLALDLLEDNVAARLPDARRSLTARALSLLDLGPPQFDPRLSSLLDPETIETVQREITMRVSQGMTTPALGAWKMLFALARHDHLHESWGVPQIKSWWPSSAEQSLALLEAMGELPNLAQPVIEAIRNAQAIAGFKATANAVDASEALNNTSNSLELNVIPVDLLSERGDPYYVFVGPQSDPDRSSSIGFRIRSLSKAPGPALGREILGKDGWESLIALKTFNEDPCPSTLARALRSVTVDGSLYQALRLWTCWPLYSVMRDAAAGADLTKLAEAAEAGNFGKLDDWKAAEERWAERGVNENDLLRWREGYFLSREIASIGAPAPKAVSSRQVGSWPKPELAKMLISVIGSHPIGPKRDALLGYLLIAARGLGAKDKLLLFRILDLLFASNLADLNQSRLLSFIGSLPEEAWEWDRVVTLADALGRDERLVSFEPLVRAPDNVMSAYNREPTRRVLLYFIASLVNHSRRRLRLRVDLNLVETAFQHHPGDGPRIFVSVLALKLATGKWSREDVPHLVDQLLPFDGSGRSERVRRLLIKAPEDDRDLLGELLFALQQRMNVRYPDEASRMIARLKNNLDERRSRLSISEVCTPLHLPVSVRALGENGRASA